MSSSFVERCAKNLNAIVSAAISAVSRADALAISPRSANVAGIDRG